ncbi:hypothetical protein HZC07_06220 [Candidatus Micrarchaeota archaeon]|nr:hypothetical protein [Candidatus Micrarchaeota archaeon]
MKFFIVFAILIGLFVVPAFAEDGATKATCPSSEQLVTQILACKASGNNTYIYYYDSSKCQQIKCTPIASTTPATNTTSSTTNGTDTANENTTRNCPSQISATGVRYIEMCKINGQGYEYITDTTGCRIVKCTQQTNDRNTTNNTTTDNCPSYEVLTSQLKRCSAINQSGTTYVDENGCKEVKCTTLTNCPSYETLTSSITKCSASGNQVTTYLDENNCKQVKCSNQNPAGVLCKKSVDEKNCVQISCEDGYTYNSCAQNQCKVQRIECKNYKDGNGCEVKECDDGTEKKECPKPTPPTTNVTENITTNQTVSCKVYTEEGCTIKICTDGTKTKDCPKTSIIDDKLNRTTNSNDEGIIQKIMKMFKFGS